ncbi:flippase [Methanobacterium movens]|jgi:stage V sporulation protein B|nr:MAG: polysaccharide biosynthesis protein [Methanobacterium sp.]
MANLIKGSFIILIGNILFRIGGYLYRMLMQFLLGVEGYGILSVVLPVQWILILIAAAGLPPAIAKYVSEYKAQNNFYMVKKIIFVSAKIMLCMSIIFSVSLYFFAPYLVDLLNADPNTTILFQMVALITPFSILLGLFRGVFQGYQEMTYILITRAAEQIFMISLAVILTLAGLYVLGAVIGSILGFAASAVVAFLIFKKEMWENLQNIKIPSIPVNDVKIAKKLIFFSFPIILAGLSELALFDTSTMIIKIFMDNYAVGYYNIASPVARLPLVISTSVSVAILPAASEALAIKGNNLLKKYVIQSYRYLLLVLLPICIVIMLFSEPLLNILFPKAPLAYLFVKNVLTILIIGMGFYSIYGISSSISQGVGKPYPPMIFLVIGGIINLGLTFYLVPRYGLNGAAISTTVSAFFIMILCTYTTLRITKVKLPYFKLFKIIIASLLLGLILIIMPKSTFGLIFASILTPFIYLIILAFINGLENQDLIIINKVGLKIKPFTKFFIKFSQFLKKINELINQKDH